MCRLTVASGTPASAAAGRNVRENTSMWRLTAPRRGSSGCLTMNIELQKLDHRGVGHSASLTHGLQAVTDARLSHVVQHRRHDPGPGGAERMAQGDRAAARV